MQKLTPASGAGCGSQIEMSTGTNPCRADLLK